jgi:RNA polymerase sigma-70 factor (ECF subfamily)
MGTRAQSAATDSFEKSLAEARSGSSTALGELLDQFRSYLLLIADEELEPQFRERAAPSDIVQLTQLEAHRDLGQFRGRTSDEFRDWLRQILIHNLADARRSAARQKDKASGFDETMDFREIPSTDPSPSSIVSAQDQDDAFTRMLEALPAHYRQVIQLRHFERWEFSAIGPELGCSAEAARKLWTRALRQLQSQARRLT